LKAYDITKLIAELKSDNIQYINKTVYITVVVVVVLFWCRRSIATGISALTPYLDLLGIGKLRPLHQRNIVNALKVGRNKVRYWPKTPIFHTPFHLTCTIT